MGKWEILNGRFPPLYGAAKSDCSELFLTKMESFIQTNPSSDKNINCMMYSYTCILSTTVLHIYQLDKRIRKERGRPGRERQECVIREQERKISPNPRAGVPMRLSSLVSVHSGQEDL